MKNRITKEILEKLNKERVEYLILRNYRDFKNEKDVDIVISKKDKLKVNKIAGKFGLKKGIDFGHYLSYKNEFVWLDIRIGGIVYRGFLFENFDRVFSRKKKFGEVYVLSDEDSLVHLVLHSIIDKKFYKEKYIREIEKLIKSVGEKKLIEILHDRLGMLGNELFFLIKRKKYEESLKLRRRILLKLFRFRDLPNFLILNLVRILR